ncbi:MAG: HEPN domain-containing protein [Bacteroidales bacterium]|nr:HEPN domain-containing protein [Bacteroidales bacterium]
MAAGSCKCGYAGRVEGRFFRLGCCGSGGFGLSLPLQIEFHMNDKSTYWVEIADYDLATARALLSTGRYLYVGFMCHQTIEKILKAYWSKVLEEPPLKIHHLSRLAAKSGLVDLLSEEQLVLIDLLEPLNIEARYPSYKEQLSKTLTKDYCQELIERTNELYLWIKEKL